MALTINSNIGSLIIQKDLTQATKNLDLFLKRSNIEKNPKDETFEKITEPVDNKVNTKLNANSVAQDNIAIGFGILATAKSDLDNISEKLSNIEKNISSEMDEEAIAKVMELLDDVNSISSNSSFSEKKLLDGSTSEIKFQTGSNLSNENQVILPADLFKNADIKSIFGSSKEELKEMLTSGDISSFTDGLKDASSIIEKQTNEIISKQSQLDFSSAKLEVEYANIISTLSTLKDADIAETSSDNITSKILEQASATLTSVANQSPSIAINLI